MPDLSSGAINSVKREVGDVLSSGNYYVTPELQRELSSIQNGLDHLNLDSNILNSSTGWRKSLSASAAGHSNGGLQQALGHAAGVISGVKNKLDKKNVSQMQENQIREAHHQAMQDLINLKEGIQPYSARAHCRVNQFSDHIGVSDRYTGYRSNLTRGSRDPFKLDSYWMRELNKQRVKFDDTGINRGLKAPQRSTYSQYQTSQRAAALNKSSIESTVAQSQPAVYRPHTVPTMMSRPLPTKSIQEACGINTTYPGRTEYMTRYKRPTLNKATSDFIINPIPDYLIYGRPIAKMVYEPGSTEYQNRYEWPDGRKIIKLPWLRK